VIVGVQADEDIDFAYTDELTEKVVGEDRFVGHLKPLPKES